MVALAETSSFVLICTGRRKILNTKLLHYLDTEDSKGKATEEFYSMDLKQKTAKGTEKEREPPLKNSSAMKEMKYRQC